MLVLSKTSGARFWSHLHQWSHLEEPVPVYLTLSESRTGPAGRSAPRGNCWCLHANQTRGKVNDSWDPSQRRCGFYRRPCESCFHRKRRGEAAASVARGNGVTVCSRVSQVLWGDAGQRAIVVRLSISDAVVEEKSSSFHAWWETAACRGQGPLWREQPGWRAAVAVIAWNFQRVLDPQFTFGHLSMVLLGGQSSSRYPQPQPGWRRCPCRVALPACSAAASVWDGCVGNTSSGGNAGGSRVSFRSRHATSKASGWNAANSCVWKRLFLILSAMHLDTTYRWGLF